MKRKKGIIVICILILLSLFGTYIYSVFKDVVVLGGCGTIAPDSVITINTIDALEKNILINIESSVIAGEEIKGEVFSVYGDNMEDFLNYTTGYKPIDLEDGAKITITEENTNGDIVEEYQVKSKEHSSKWIFLKKGKKYCVNINSKEFKGAYLCIPNIYKLF
ncbi:MAG: hypothetical protein E7214_10290 [Clostridium sp.]|nr:hypothetical protein [Clostridium sp.]